MLQSILTQIENISKSLQWIKKNKPEDYAAKFLQMVDERRKLRKLQTAKQDNPAIAAYGVSQVGKSYLINCLLQKEGKPFILEADGKAYNFIEEMNPKTDNTEATGVVTRFSSFSTDPDRYCDKYPILMRCLSVADVIQVLSDGYYNDINDYTTPGEEDIERKADEIYERYKNCSENPRSPLQPDDILDIKAYYEKYINNAQAFIHKKSFFDKIALVADRIPSNEWVSVFSILWDNSTYQTRLFNKMVSTLEKFRFAKYVYLPPQALLHEGINENTVMSVQCLNELFLEQPVYFSDVYLREGNDYVRLEKCTKSEICAVCAEIIVKIGEKYQQNMNRYCFDNITDPNVTRMLTQGDVKMDVLQNNDMLDFPGARSRKKQALETMGEDKILINVLLRGKVAYLFNMYNDSKLINILLYCHHGEKNEVSEIPLLLKDWILNNVGRTMEDRRRTLELTGGISPLFYIGTKFNIDMRSHEEQIANSINALAGRWQQRFEKVLYHECFNADGNLDDEKTKIFLNWTREGEHFQNSYVLRDFKFSGLKGSTLYENEKTLMKRMLITQEHYDNLRNTFCQSEHVKCFFANPELSWDVCASIDNDGSLYIIENLSKIAAKMTVTRDEQFRAILAQAGKKLRNMMQGYYVSTDLDELLESNIKKARAVFREMDFTCNTDNYYFGHLLQALQMTETESFSVVHDIMRSPEINGKVNDFKDYEIIRNSCKKAGHDIEMARNDNERWDCIMQTYSLESIEEAKDYLQRKGVMVEKLFSGSYKRKLNSCIIADAVFDKWVAHIRSVEFLNEFTSDKGFDGTIMGSLIDNIVNMAGTMMLRDILAASIAEYVNVVNIHSANESLLADMLASHINEFVLDFGYSRLSDEEKAKVKALCKSRNLPAFNYIEKELPATFGEQDLTELFNSMSESPQALLPSFEDNYNKWVEYMFISFVSKLDVPEFDHEANAQLAEILEGIRV